MRVADSFSFFLYLFPELLTKKLPKNESLLMRQSRRRKLRSFEHHLNFLRNFKYDRINHGQVPYILFTVPLVQFFYRHMLLKWFNHCGCKFDCGSLWRYFLLSFCKQHDKYKIPQVKQVVRNSSMQNVKQV